MNELCPHCGRPLPERRSHYVRPGPPYKGFLSAYVDEIIQMNDAGDSTRTIAKALYAKGVRPTSSYSDYSAVENIQASVRNVLGRYGKRLAAVNAPLRLTERNLAIHTIRIAGATFKAIGQSYGISIARTRQIVMTMKWRLKKEAEFAGTLTDNSPIEAIAMPVRARNALLNSDIRTIGDLQKTSELELLRMPNFGRASLNDLKTSLAALGLAPLKARPQ
jgi:hypothetical protein